MKPEERFLLVTRLEDLFGGPRKWETSVNEDSEDFAVDIWNEAVTRCLEIVSAMKAEDTNGLPK